MLNKLVLVGNDGNKQFIPVIKKYESLYSATLYASVPVEVELSTGVKHFDEGDIIDLWDEEEEIGMLELESLVMEGYLIHPEPIDVDFVPEKYKRVTQKEAEEIADFWGNDVI